MLNQKYCLGLLICLLGWVGTAERAQAQFIGNILPTQATYAPGQSIKLVGSVLFTSDVCDSLLITGPSSFVLLDSVDYTSNQGGSDTIYATLPLGIACGQHMLQMTIRTNCGPPASTNMVPITIADSIDFDYGDGMFCLGDMNPLPTLNTTHASPPTYAAQSGNILLNSTTGELFLQGGALTTDNIVGTTAGTACFDTHVVPVEIRDVTNGYTLTYPNPNPCGATPTPLAVVTTVPDTFGAFSSLPAGIVFLDSVVGTIDLLNSIPGNYTVVYNANPNLCYNSSTFNMVIEEPDQAVFDYDSSYCATGVAQPLITTLPNGGVFGFTANPFLPINSVTGEIDLNNVLPNSYIISYTPINACRIQTFDTLIVNALPNASFSYPTNQFCTTSSNPLPTPVNPGGTFFDTTSVPFDIDVTAAGEIIIANSTSGGPYSVFHAYSDGVCDDTFEVQIDIIDPGTPSVTYPTTTFCQNDSTVAPIFTSGLLGGTFFSVPAMPANVMDPFGVIDLTICPADSYAVYYSLDTAGCVDSTLVDIIRVDSFYKDLNFSVPGLICEDTGNVAINITPNTNGLDNYFFLLEKGGADFTGQAFFQNDSFSTNVILPGGVYNMDMVFQRGVCIDTIRTNFILQERPDPTFYYLDSIFCENGDNPIPFVLNGGGTFYSDNPNVVFTGPSYPGEINLNASQDTTFVVYYNAGTADCPSIATDTVSIIGSDGARFNYPNSEPCRDLDSIIPNLVGGASAGIYTINDSLNCPIDSLTGVIMMATCQPGTYSITNTLSSSSGDCDATFVTSIVVSQHDTTVVFDYPNLSYCPNDTLAPATFSFDTTVSTFLFPGVSGVVFSDTMGTINLVNSTAGTHFIRFDIDGICPQTFYDTITIEAFTDPRFWFGPDSLDPTNNPDRFFCTTEPSPTPWRFDSSGTFLTFTVARDTVPWINPTTGQFDLSQVASNDLNPFTICYTPNTGCTFTFCDQIFVNLGPENAILNLIENDSICEGDSVTFVAGGGDGYVWLLQDTLLPAAQLDNIFTYSPSPEEMFDSMKVSVLIGNSQQCNARIDTFITVNPRPTVTFVDVPTTVSSNNFVDLDVSSPGVNNVTFNWFTGSVGSVVFLPPDGFAGPVGLGQVGTISSLITLEDEGSPAQIIFFVVPETDECIGDTLSDTIRVNPLDQPIFVPEVFTPNGDGINDIWEIQWRQDYNLMEYRMQVFNRSGALVFEMSPVVPTWDGGNLPDGVYWWKLLNETGVKELSGGLTIRRR